MVTLVVQANYGRSIKDSAVCLPSYVADRCARHTRCLAPSERQFIWAIINQLPVGGGIHKSSYSIVVLTIRSQSPRLVRLTYLSNFVWATRAVTNLMIGSHIPMDKRWCGDRESECGQLYTTHFPLPLSKILLSFFARVPMRHYLYRDFCVYIQGYRESNEREDTRTQSVTSFIPRVLFGLLYRSFPYQFHA